MAAELDYCLYQRRSIRKFTAEPVERADIQALLERAILAPSASNLQPWRFVVIDEQSLVQRIKSFTPGLGGQPPCLLLFCLDAALLPKREDGAPDSDAASLDAAMAAENLMLAAVERGLGSCVVKSFHAKLVQRILRLPDTLLPQFLLTLGHPDQTPRMPRRRPLETLVSYNIWNEEAPHGTSL